MRAFDEACQRCATEIEAGGFDLLFANSSLLYFMPYIMRHVRIPKVLYLQEPYRPLYEANPILPWVNSQSKDLHHLYPFRSGALVFENLHLRALRVQARLEWLNARACDVILVNSYYSRESILRAYGCEAKVCYLGVDTGRFRNLHKKREYFILGLGAFAKNKGVELSIKSISQLPEPRPRLIWIANSVDHSYLEKMRTAATAANVELQIQSSVTDEVLVDLLNRASLLLYTPHLEPFGLAPLEANACATPVIAVAEGGIRETIQDGVNGFLVDREPEAIAKALQRVLSDTTLARQMGERAAAYVQEKWNIDLSIDRLEDNLFRVMSKCT
jgi:glycosyltransferase involved in cell wall biosynthesis